MGLAYCRPPALHQTPSPLRERVGVRVKIRHMRQFAPHPGPLPVYSPEGERGLLFVTASDSHGSRKNQKFKLLRRTVNSAHRQLRGPFSPREKDTPPGMEAVDRVGNKRSRMRASFTAVCPHPDPLDSGSKLRSTSSIHGVVPQGEGEKQYALFGGRISKTRDWIAGGLDPGNLGCGR